MEGVTPPDVPDVNRVCAGIQRLLTPRLACPCATRQKKSDAVIEKFGMGDAGQGLKSFGVTGTKEEHDALFDKWDADKSGTIDYNE